MVRWRRTPAIFAGLAGGAVWGVPVLAGATTMDGAIGEVLVTLDDLLASPVAYFFVGLATGAAVTGIAVGVGEHRSKRRLRRQLGEVSAENERLRAASVPTPTVIHISSPGVVLEPWPPFDREAGVRPPAGGVVAAGDDGLGDTADLERFASSTPKDTGEGVGTDELPPVGPSVPMADLAGDLDEPESESGASAEGAPLRDGELPDAVILPEPEPNAPAQAALGRARTARVRLKLNATLPRLEDDPLPPFGGEAGVTRRAGVSGPSRPVAAAAPVMATPPVPSGDGGRTADEPGQAVPSRSASADDYEHVAEEYVRSSRASKRAQSRSRGVRAILGERLRGNVMDGLPVIERPDGSTADIGTSWWTREVGSTHSFAPLDPSATSNLPPVTAAPDPMSTAALRADELARAQRNARIAGLSSAQDDTSRLDGTTRAAAIAQRLSSVDMSLYPEEHGSQGEDGDDMFEQALRALDAQDSEVIATTTSEEAAAAPQPISEDLQTGAVVTSDTLADADRDKAASDYVDYLVRDEMERNRARRGQRTSHSILTVFEGTGDLSDAQRSRGGRHFADPQGHDGGGRSREA